MIGFQSITWPNPEAAVATLTRKQREVEQRERLILDVATEMVSARGYLGLNMDRIAEATEYSKGTIYQHFSCKEDVLIALAVEAHEKRISMFARAAAFDGHPRERLAAICVACELSVRLYPENFKIEQILRTASIWEKTSPDRQSVLRSCETGCMNIVAGIIRDALGQGDLILPAATGPEDLGFALWSMSYGAASIMTTSGRLDELGIGEPFACVRRSMTLMLDGYGWKPLSKDWDYPRTFERIHREVFPDETQRVFAA